MVRVFVWHTRRILQERQVARNEKYVLSTFFQNVVSILFVTRAKTDCVCMLSIFEGTLQEEQDQKAVDPTTTKKLRTSTNVGNAATTTEKHEDLDEDNVILDKATLVKRMEAYTAGCYPKQDTVSTFFFLIFVVEATACCGTMSDFM